MINLIKLFLTHNHFLTQRLRINEAMLDKKNNKLLEDNVGFSKSYSSRISDDK